MKLSTYKAIFFIIVLFYSCKAKKKIVDKVKMHTETSLQESHTSTDITTEILKDKTVIYTVTSEDSNKPIKINNYTFDNAKSVTATFTDKEKETENKKTQTSDKSERTESDTKMKSEDKSKIGVDPLLFVVIAIVLIFALYFRRNLTSLFRYGTNKKA